MIANHMLNVWMANVDSVNDLVGAWVLLVFVDRLLQASMSGLTRLLTSNVKHVNMPICGYALRAYHFFIG